MEINESSEYVKARALLLARYFSQRGWLVTAGKNNCILIYVGISAKMASRSAFKLYKKID